MILISNAQRDSLVRLLARVGNLDLPKTTANRELLRQIKILSRSLESKQTLGREERYRLR
jgi:hypothetical protein